MVGDVNLYFNDPDEPKHGEIEIMIAEKNSLRKGLATEALLLMMKYAILELETERFIAKISDKNEKSLNLFQNKLNYQVFKKVEVFEEVHLDLNVNSGDTGVDNMLKAVQCQIAEDIPTDKMDA